MIDFEKATELPHQDEIISQWDDSYEGVIQVSIICITYNQEKYIGKAIDGFLQQKTKFPFEIIIHDDASTDATPDILQLYRKNYPNIIKLILQKENQFSTSMYLPLKNCFELVSSSRYIALCEGDDYWIEPKKIQSQYESLEKYKDLDICFTKALSQTRDGKIREINNYGTDIKVFTLSEVVQGGGSFIPTASIFIRKRVIVKIPTWIKNTPTVDYYLQVIGSSPKGALFLPLTSCIYRARSIGSWTDSRSKVGVEEILSDYEKHLKYIDYMKDFDVHLNDINVVKAKASCNASFNLIGYKDYKSVEKTIVESWRFSKYSNKLQVMIYFSRKNKTLLNSIFSLLK